MATRRTFFVKMPSVAGQAPYLDVLPMGPVGTPAEPVGDGTDGPAGWQEFPNNIDGDGLFYEVLGRVLRFETTEGDDGFVPRARLGFEVSVLCMDSESDGCNIPPVVILSRSLIGTPPNANFVNLTIDDPDYGPVVRLLNSPDTEGALYCVMLSLAEQKDMDSTHAGVGG